MERTASKILLLSLLLNAAWVLSGCNSSSSSSSNSTGGGTTTTISLPLGAAVQGATLSGSLAGKTLYLLGGGASFSHCWQDSEYWDGATLWYAITSLSYTGLTATSPSYGADPNCVTPTSQLGTAVFNVYSATLQNNSWSLTNLAFNTGAHSFAAPKISGNQMAYVSYEKGANAYGNIYLTTKTGTNTWTTPVAFSLNTANCNEDNPDIYSSGTKMIFESSRTNVAGTTCNGVSNHQQLWTTSLVNGTWQAPTALVGAPTSALDATQPWVDESTGNLYYTGDSTVCGGSAGNCVLEATPQGSGWSTTATAIITPTPLQPTTADGKLVYIGQYTQANGYAVASCAIATETDPTGSTTSLIDSRWTIYISACVIPL